MAQDRRGVLMLTRNGAGILRDPENMLQPDADDVNVPSKLIKQHGLVNGTMVTGPVKRNKRGLSLSAVETAAGMSPEQFQDRIPFQRLTAIDPNERFDLGITGDVSMRVVDLIAPVGKGTRGLIVAPPKAGKTQLLEQIAHSMHVIGSEVRVIALLIDERPEEVTHFRRHVEAEVFASSNDRGLQEHIQLAELTMAHIRTELECGRDLVILLDSLTRLTRAFNLKGAGARRTLSGGVDAGALEMPRRLLGLARNIENGGSVTVLATTLIGTESRMDDLIFEEFKGTGNSEIVLDRELAEARVFPAIDVLASGTRKEELLYTPEETERLAKLRRWLAGGKPKAAMTGLLKLIDRTENNRELLARIQIENR